MSLLLEKLHAINKADNEEYLATLEAASEEFVQLAVRDHLGKLRKDDASRLKGVLAKLGRTEEEYLATLDQVGPVVDMFGRLAFYEKTEEERAKLSALVEEAEERKKLLWDLSIKMHGPSVPTRKVCRRREINLATLDDVLSTSSTATNRTRR